MWRIFTLHANNDLFPHDSRDGSCMRTPDRRQGYKRYEIRILQACTQSRRFLHYGRDADDTMMPDAYDAVSTRFVHCMTVVKLMIISELVIPRRVRSE